jgi:hypothetical protein
VVNLSPKSAFRQKESDGGKDQQQDQQFHPILRLGLATLANVIPDRQSDNQQDNE